MARNSEHEVVHDTRGRKIISVTKAKRELISSYIISLIITSLLRVVLGNFINIEMESMDEYLKPTILYGILDLLMFAATWSVTYKLFMNKYAIRGIEKMAYKSTMVMINIVVCIYISVSMLTDVKDSIKELENEYNQLMSVYSMYSNYSDEVSSLVDSSKALVDNTLEEFKDKMHTIALIKIALSICGNFIGWSMVKRDVENMGVAEEEYKMCMNIEENDRPYTTNVQPVPETDAIEAVNEPEMNDFTTLDNLR